MSNTDGHFLLLSTAEGIAKALQGIDLPYTVAPVTQRHCIILTAEGGRTLNVRFTHSVKKDRVTVTCGYPHGITDSSTEYFRITAAAHRDPASIARQIARDIIPEYEPELARLLKRDASWKAAAAERDKVTEHLVQSSEGKIQLWYKGGDDGGNDRLTFTGDRFGDIDVTSGGTVRMELRGLSPEEAAAVIAVLPKI